MRPHSTISFLLALTLLASACSSSAETSTAEGADEAVISAPDGDSEIVSEPPDAIAIVETDDDIDANIAAETTTSTTTSIAPVTTDTVAETTTSTSPSTTPVTTDTTAQDEEDDEIETCESPELQAHYVDVALDDSDGGLKVRAEAGADGNVLATFERGKELISIGNCEIVGSTDWWEVTTSGGSLTGWASSNFLSDAPVLNPGIGAFSSDQANIGIEALTEQEMIETIADNLGFDETRVITFIEGGGIDAIGAEGTWDITGAQDDSIDGYRVQVGYDFLKDANAENVLGVTTVRVDTAPLCSRGVTEDGLCI